MKILKNKWTWIAVAGLIVLAGIFGETSEEDTKADEPRFTETTDPSDTITAYV